jgi:hypothetical protein
MRIKFLFQTISVITLLTNLPVNAMDDPNDNRPPLNLPTGQRYKDLPFKVEDPKADLWQISLPLGVSVGHSYDDSSFFLNEFKKGLRLSCLHSWALQAMNPPTASSSMEEFLRRKAPDSNKTFAQLVCGVWNWASEWRITPNPGQPTMKALTTDDSRMTSTPWCFRHPDNKAWYLGDLRINEYFLFETICPKDKIPEDTPVEFYTTVSPVFRDVRDQKPILILPFKIATILIKFENALWPSVHQVSSDVKLQRYIQSERINEAALNEAIKRGYVQDGNIINYKTYGSFEKFKTAFEKYKNIVDVLEDGTCINGNSERVENLKSPLNKHANLPQLLKK